MMEKLIKKSAIFSAVLIEVLPIVRFSKQSMQECRGARGAGEKRKNYVPRILRVLL
jgi:hypothetical protein